MSAKSLISGFIGGGACSEEPEDGDMSCIELDWMQWYTHDTHIIRGASIYDVHRFVIKHPLATIQLGSNVLGLIYTTFITSSTFGPTTPSPSLQ